MQGFEWGFTVSQMYWVLAAVVLFTLGPSLYFFQERPSVHAHEVSPLLPLLPLACSLQPNTVAPAVASQCSCAADAHDLGAALHAVGGDAQRGASAVVLVDGGWTERDGAQCLFSIMLWSMGSNVLAGALTESPLELEPWT